MSELGNDRDMINKMLDLLHHEMSRQLVTPRIATKLMFQFMERLHGFSNAGFMPISTEELKITLDELFADTLWVLKATSIHSNHKELANYKGYWEHRELGPFFQEKNSEFLLQGNGRKMMRVYACDSIGDSVAETWFNDTVVKHVRNGAEVKVIQIVEQKAASYEDFGIYEHKVGNHDAGTYLLLAPRELNHEAEGLRTIVSSGSERVKAYDVKFDAMWKQSDQPLKIVTSNQMDDADKQKLESHGEGRINDLFEKRIILRKMTRLDIDKRIVPESFGFVRKYQMQYAQAVSDHIKECFPDVKHLFYVGDTYKNDGFAIRNLQFLRWDVTGFICEPKLAIRQLWFNSVLYTDRWTDLISFVERIKAKVDTAPCLAIFDIDQTLWAPKGVADLPLNYTRIQAILKLVDEYVEPSKGPVAEEIARQAKSRIVPLYNEVSERKYLNHLTLDNEDYKAAICVFLALNVIWDQQKLEGVNTKEGAAFFQDLSRWEPHRFLNYIREEYLPTFLREGTSGEANMTHFMMDTLSTTATNQFNTYGVENGLNPTKIREDAGAIFREMVGTSTVKYQLFRNLELQEALALTASTGDPKKSLVLNKPAWDVASWLKEKAGVTLLGLSDRPDEATFVPDGESLLDAKMGIYGKAIKQYLPPPDHS